MLLRLLQIFSLFLGMTWLLASTSYAQDQDILHPGERLNIIIYGESDLSGKYKISDSGTITMPLIGIIPVNNLTLEKLRQTISEKYADGYLINPVITVDLLENGHVYVMGEVRNPGQYEFQNKINALKAVALAGGFTYRANTEEFELLRNTDNKEEKKMMIDPYEVMIDGDIITIKERFF